MVQVKFYKNNHFINSAKNWKIKKIDSHNLVLAFLPKGLKSYELKAE